MSTISPMDFVTKEIASNHVTVFAKSHCPHSAATKALFAELNITAKIYDLDKMEDGAAIQAALLERTGQKTVPNVFVKGQHVGGNDKTQAAHKSGDLAKMLA